MEELDEQQEDQPQRPSNARIDKCSTDYCLPLEDLFLGPPTLDNGTFDGRIPHPCQTPPQ